MAWVKRRVLLLSSSRLHGYEYLEHARQEIDDFLQKTNVKTILFIPYALADHDKYTKTVAGPLTKWGYQVEGIHMMNNQIDAIKNAESIFIGGGNSFVLLKTLYDKGLIEQLRDQVLNHGLPYIGSSAGTNVATRSIHTTNDMPVAYPPTFDALKLVPFNINPHYLQPDAKTEHKGETREERLKEFIKYHNIPVVGLREGTSLLVEGDNVTLLGMFNARLFEKDKSPTEFEPGSDFSFLLFNEK